MTSNRALSMIAAVCAVSAVATSARADQVVQIDVTSLLNGRTVSTYTGGKVVPWTVGQGVDGAGNADGFVTMAVETALGQTGTALPDDGTFPADADHPEVVLNFSNAAPATSPQTYHLLAAGNFHFSVPQATYSKLYLFMTSSEGAQTHMSVTLTYADATTSVIAVPLPDYGTGQALPSNPAAPFFNLISGMHKWTSTDQQTDTPVHTITGVTLTPTAGKEVTTVEVDKGTDTNWLVFWGATGVATSPVDGGTSPTGGSGSTVADASASSGAAGSSSGAASGTPTGGESGTTASGAASGESSGSSESGAATSASGANNGPGSGAGASGDESSGSSTSSGSSNGAGSGAESSNGGGGGSSGCSVAVRSRGGEAGLGATLVLMGFAARRRRTRRASRRS